jgi:hypothetical protein
MYSACMQLRADVEAALPSASFVGYIMDSTATNRKAMQMLQKYHPRICVIPWASHALKSGDEARRQVLQVD